LSILLLNLYTKYFDMRVSKLCPVSISIHRLQSIQNHIPLSFIILPRTEQQSSRQDVVTPIVGRAKGTAFEGDRIRHQTAGRLVNYARNLSPLGRAFVDDQTAISQELADKVALKALNLQIFLLDEESQEAACECQIGLIRGERLPPSPEMQAVVRKRKRGKHMNSGCADCREAQHHEFK
jgi:hypothetical protein